ncbi:Crp/Fnr family transcriptional regulator [uncultured Imperialibacter sp.]|uniref:Crp/Fnr family transcriptional regulator n=1 Tax=uncultured Imperialibacter sp. TaxID=1672639 RepID=UPI0030DAD3CA|tara:strand:- start:88702 stop:89280 length:579 start_codon:yes stop_codon:yes gene_type:complete
MVKNISEMIGQHMTLTEEETEVLNDCIPIRSYKKGTILLREGQIATECYFNIKGCVRHYYLSDGEEKTTQFYTEEQSIASMNSYLNKVPANHYLECLEDTTLAVFGYEKEKELYRKHPKFESLCRLSMEDDFGKQQEMLANYIIQSPEERYLNLLETRPNLLNRVPQYHLASYLGVKPESLSRIRKRVAEKR